MGKGSLYCLPRQGIRKTRCRTRTPRRRLLQSTRPSNPPGRWSGGPRNQQCPRPCQGGRSRWLSTTPAPLPQKTRRHRISAAQHSRRQRNSPFASPLPREAGRHRRQACLPAACKAHTYTTQCNAGVGGRNGRGASSRPACIGCEEDQGGAGLAGTTGRTAVRNRSMGWFRGKGIVYDPRHACFLIGGGFLRAAAAALPLCSSAHLVKS